MKAIEQRKAAEKFAKNYLKRSLKETEDQITQTFWLTLLRDVYGVQNADQFISFEKRVRVPGSKKPKRIDGFIASTKVLIEQKSRGVCLDNKIEQSGGILLTPYGQAKRYADNLTYDDRPRWIVVCNFEEFRIHDLNSERADEYQLVRLEDLPKEYHRLGFLQDITSTNVYKEMDVSRKAGKLIGEIYTELMKQYPKLDERAMHELNVLCVRLVFCLYAEDAGIFAKNKFGNYLRDFAPGELKYKLQDLFTALGTEDAENLFIDPKAKEFEYVNDGLFKDTTIPVPPITEEVKQLLVKKSSDDFNWEDISPTIFGAMFESTLNPESRRKGGMHYTSVENIHKVIDPLFLEDLEKELDAVLKVSTEKLRRQKIRDFQEKLAGITCLDPACGSGNFLTETYMSLRRLENKAIREYYRDQPALMGGVLNPIRVSINQFHGIEINDFAVSVAKTAMWIAEYQMRVETYSIVQFNDPYLPLRTKANILHANALRTDWNDVVPAERLTYIVGNPPFVGYTFQTKQQKADLAAVLKDEQGKAYPSAKKMDFVTGWFVKSAQMMQCNPKIRTVLVSTNSVVQGEHVSCLWKQLVEQFGVQINFAWRSFKWQSESDGKAKVICVIVGFGIEPDKRTPILFDGENREEVKHINPYLMDYEDVWIIKRNKGLCDSPKMMTGNRPTDGGFLVVEAEEYKNIEKLYPEVLPYVKPYVGSKEYINKLERYCLWLKDASLSVIRGIPYIRNRVEQCREVRLASTDKGRQKLAETPWLFREMRNPIYCMVVPAASSGKRDYIPMGFIDDSIITSDQVFIVPHASVYEFGILSSSLHVAWAGVIGGRLKDDFRYSNVIVYNNFPWPDTTEKQRDKITTLAQAVLDARAEYPESSLADMYDPNFMPPALRKAHKNLDRAVLKLYGLKPDTEESGVVRHLLTLYKKLTEK